MVSGAERSAGSRSAATTGGCSGKKLDIGNKPYVWTRNGESTARIAADGASDALGSHAASDISAAIDADVGTTGTGAICQSGLQGAQTEARNHWDHSCESETVVAGNHAIRN